VIAAGFLLRFGHLIDEQPVRKLSYGITAVLAASAGLLAVVWHPVALFFALTGLRVAGQGLMSHVSISVMSRYYDKDRGKALSLSSLGYSMGEMVLPALLGLVIALSSWRMAAGMCAMIVLMLFLILKSMRLERFDLAAEISDAPAIRIGKRKFYWKMFKEERFWILAGTSLSLGFVVTGFFFYQFLLADAKRWPVEVYTAIFTGYGAIRFVFSLYGGTLTDKFSAMSLYPYYLIPVAIGVMSIGLLPGLYAAFVFLFLTGVSMGAAGVINSAVIAELYGVDQIGKVRSLFSVMGVFSTAMAPLVFGVLLDLGVSFDTLGYISALIMAASILNGMRIRKYRNNPELIAARNK
jgi:MFS family permease